MPMKLFDAVPHPVGIVADGTSTAVLFDLKQAPFSIEFGGRLPTGVYSVGEFTDGVLSATPVASIEGTTVTLTFPTPPPAGPYTGSISFTY